MTALENGYAQALLDAALARGNVERIAEELPEIGKLVFGFNHFFCNPKISWRQKASLLKETLGGRADALTIEFLALLAQQRRLKSLPGICARFAKLAEDSLGKITINLRVPFPPDESLLERLRAYLASRGVFPAALIGNVSFNIVIDKRLLGGFIAEYNGRSLDASLRARLGRLNSVK